MIRYARLELRRLARDSGYLIMGLVSPLLMYLAFTNLTGMTGKDHHDSALYGMVGMAGFGALGAVLTSGVGVAEDKALGWLRQLRTIPLTPLSVVTGRLACAMVVAIPPILAVCLAGAVVNGISLSPGQWAAVLALLWVGVVPIALLGLGAGYLLDAQKAQAVGLIGYMGLSLVGGLWLPIDKFPGWLRAIAGFTPVNRYGGLSWQVVDGRPPTMAGVGILLAWGVAFGALAVLGYRRGARS